jgi:hypothetical protein
LDQGCKKDLIGEGDVRLGSNQPKLRGIPGSWHPYVVVADHRAQADIGLKPEPEFVVHAEPGPVLVIAPNAQAYAIGEHTLRFRAVVHSDCVPVVSRAGGQFRFACACRIKRGLKLDELIDKGQSKGTPIPEIQIILKQVQIVGLFKVFIEKIKAAPFGAMTDDLAFFRIEEVSQKWAYLDVTISWNITYFRSKIITYGFFLETVVPFLTLVLQVESLGEPISSIIRRERLEDESFACPKIVLGSQIVLKPEVPVVLGIKLIILV